MAILGLLLQVNLLHVEAGKPPPRTASSNLQGLCTIPLAWQTVPSGIHWKHQRVRESKQWTGMAYGSGYLAWGGSRAGGRDGLDRLGNTVRLIASRSLRWAVWSTQSLAAYPTTERILLASITCQSQVPHFTHEKAYIYLVDILLLPAARTLH